MFSEFLWPPGIDQFCDAISLGGCPWFQKIKNLPVTPRGPLRKFFFRVCVRHFGTIFVLLRIFGAENVMTRGVRA